MNIPPIKTVSSINLLGKNRVYVPTEKKEVKSIAEKDHKKQTAEKKYSDFQQVDEFSTFKSRKVYEPESTPETQNIEQTVKISA